MEKKRISRRIIRQGPLTEEQRTGLQNVRDKVMEEFPPLDPPRLQPVTDGVGSQIRAAREAQGLTWYSLAEKANIADAATIRDIEYGRDAKLSDIESVATALGLKLELVAQDA